MVGSAHALVYTMVPWCGFVYMIDLFVTYLELCWHMSCLLCLNLVMQWLVGGDLTACWVMMFETVVELIILCVVLLMCAELSKGGWSNRG